MRLSEAIRLGSAISHQIYGEWHSKDGGSCAMGSAFVALGKSVPLGSLCINNVASNIAREFPLTVARVMLPDEFPAIDEMVCADKHTRPMSLLYAITHLNDRHLLTREQIADWVEKLENPLATQLTSIPTNDQTADQTIEQPAECLVV
jgi:hypothetical protein